MWHILGRLPFTLMRFLVNCNSQTATTNTYLTSIFHVWPQFVDLKWTSEPNGEREATKAMSKVCVVCLILGCCGWGNQQKEQQQQHQKRLQQPTPNSKICWFVGSFYCRFCVVCLFALLLLARNTFWHFAKNQWMPRPASDRVATPASAPFVLLYSQFPCFACRINLQFSISANNFVFNIIINFYSYFVSVSFLSLLLCVSFSL